MGLLRTLVLGAAVAATSSVATAQRLGTVELGAFAHYTIVKNDAQLGEHSSGYGGRGGVFLAKWIEGEIEWGHGTVATKGVRYPEGSWSPTRVFGTLNLPLARRAKLLLGVGYVDTWKGDITYNEYEEGVSALAGIRICVGDAWSIRPEVVFDRLPEPTDAFQRNYLYKVPGSPVSTRWQLRLGISRFFVRGTQTCAQPKPESTLPNAGRNRPTPPLPPAPPVTPPASLPVTQPLPVTATLNAASSRINAGQAASLTWNSANASRCTAPWMSGSATSGTQSVYPASNTTYSVTCTGAGAAGSASASVDVTQPAPPPPPPAPLREIFRLSGVYFDFDKSTIKPAGRVMLDSAAKILNASTDLRVQIEGHTDSMGSDAYNMSLSERRAVAVRDYLVSKGISAARLSTQGFGESRPVSTNDTKEGRAENRRVMIIEMRN